MPSAIPRPAQALIALLLALGLSFGAASLAHAAQPSVTYVNDSQGVRLVFEPSPDNLLPSLNDVMPGDEVSSSLMVENAAGNAETVRLYVRSLGYSKGSEELLSHLSLTVRKNGSPVSDDRANVPGGLAAWTFLGQFDPGEKASLKVTLKVPIELDSSHMNTEGVFKWEFLAEEVDGGTVDPGPPGPVDPKPPVDPDDPDDPNDPDDPADPDDPDKPANPDDPDDPNDPDDPSKPNDPDGPGKPDKPSSPDKPGAGDKPGSSGGKPGKVPGTGLSQTGDGALAAAACAGACACAALLVILFAKRRREDEADGELEG